MSSAGGAITTAHEQVSNDSKDKPLCGTIVTKTKKDIGQGQE